MTHRSLLISLAAGVALAVPAKLSAQQVQPDRQAQAGSSQKQAPRNPRLDVEELTPGQIQRAQEFDRPAPGVAPPAKSAAPRPAQAAQVIACNGPFGKDSSHVKLAAAYKAENVDSTEMDPGDGKKLMITVLFPKDPKRRLEVWWQDEDNRSGTYLIVLNGQSTWTAPKGLRLGFQFPAVEKLNGKPFKIKGFNNDGVGTVSDWQGGAFEQLPGGCRLGVSFRVDSKASAQARSAISSDKDFISSDAIVRAVKPAVSEILIGY